MHEREDPHYNSPRAPAQDGAQSPPLPARLEGLSALANRFDALLCDVWGVVHDGRNAFEPACAALARFRQSGGKVLLLSNAPRPAGAVATQLKQFGVPDTAYDHILTSGDCCRAALAEGRYGRRLGHLGPARDLPLFDALRLERIPLAQAQQILCTGFLDDEQESVETYAPLLTSLRQRGGRFLCANPDIVVMRGARHLPCAGALAEFYQSLGGEVVHFGKPHAPVYDAARALLPPDAKLLVVGDGMETDIAGASQQNIPSIFITGGIARPALGDNPDPAAIARLAQKGTNPHATTLPTMPHAYMPNLFW